MKQHYSPKVSLKKIRVRLFIPPHYEKTPIFSQLIADYGLTVNIVGAKLNQPFNHFGRLELEIQGEIRQITQGLDYLRSFELIVINCPSTKGNSWCY